VAIYIGMGWMVHAPKAGDWVREAPIGSPGRISGWGRVK
jgi:cell wall-associated NlpC family hydrolase